MKVKHVISTIVFLLIFSVLFTGTTYLLRPEDDQAKESVAGFYAEDHNSLDVVLYGGSACYRYVIPPLIWKEYGVTSYVFGTAAQPFETLPALITETQKSQTPSLYVVEIRNLIMDDIDQKNNNVNQLALTHYMRDVTDNLLLSFNRFQLIYNEVKDTDKTDWYFDIIKNHTNWKTLGLHSFDLMLYNKKSAVEGTRTVGVLQPQKEFDGTQYADKKTPVGSDAQAKLIKVLNELKKQNANILFVSTPYVETEQSLTEENYVADIIKSYGYPYLNMNYDYKQLGIDYATDFYNNRHTNTLGAVKVTNYLAKYIADNYKIPHDHTGALAKEWDTAYTTWSSVTENNQEKALAVAIKKAEKK
jgi:hypothetical protein